MNTLVLDFKKWKMTIKQDIAFFYLNSKAEAIINEGDIDDVCE